MKMLHLNKDTLTRDPRVSFHYWCQKGSRSYKINVQSNKKVTDLDVVATGHNYSKDKVANTSPSLWNETL